jgi:hypothetical protein
MLKHAKKLWFNNVKVGDMLYPNKLWNSTEREPNCLTIPTKILGITRARSQSGVLFKVRTKGGFIRLLDAGWFKQPKAETEAEVTANE